ncbi:hypothetical protein E2C01_056188 [Portunus trituberculatus]|uniref:Uncharacterized protein n=1 Tax=Portunus trituberculatus TaxID=210409 RepID=A0A5B7GWW9_PORTR|nr:hypothetical protein [Portunus trituberculatus]
MWEHCGYLIPPNIYQTVFSINM